MLALHPPLPAAASPRLLGRRAEMTRQPRGTGLDPAKRMNAEKLETGLTLKMLKLSVDGEQSV